MKDKFENIEDLFRDGFEHFEADVDPKIWENISNQIGQSGSVQDPGSSSSSSVSAGGVATGSGVVKIALVAGTAGILSVGTYMYVSDEGDMDVPVGQPKNEVFSPEDERSAEYVGEIVQKKGDKVLKDFSSKETEVSLDKTQEEFQNTNEISAISKKKAVNIAPGNANAGNSESQPEQGHENQASQEENVQKAEVKKNSPQTSKTSLNDPAVSGSDQKVPFEASIYTSVQHGKTPLRVRFENRGSQADQITWIFGNESNISNYKKVEYTFESSGEYWVYLEIENDKGERSRDSVLIAVKGSAVINVPNIFTPNGDGYNDAFTVETENVETINCQIFSQQGNLVYRWESIYGHWDGRDMSGDLLPEGTYFVVITGVDKDGNPVEPIRKSLTLNR